MFSVHLVSSNISLVNVSISGPELLRKPQVTVSEYAKIKMISRPFRQFTNIILVKVLVDCWLLGKPSTKVVKIKKLSYSEITT